MGARAGNKGARTAGIDRATVAWIETRGGVEAFLGGIRDSLKSGEFRRSRCGEVMIPKAQRETAAVGHPDRRRPGGPGRLKLVLEPIFEADFQPCSYGFRPNRRAHDAIAEIHHFTDPVDYQWVLEADIEACLDASSHCSFH